MNSRQIFSHCNHSQVINPDVFVSGQGDQVFTNDRCFRDLTSGLWNVNWGYNSNHYAKTYSDQIGKLQYYPNCFHSTTDITEQAAIAITKFYSMSGVYFGTGGSDSIRVSTYISKLCTGKSQIISHTLGYHGSDSLSVLSKCISQTVGADTAAVIVEPIMTTYGVFEYPQAELLLLAQLRKQLGFLIIFDETVTGLRTDLIKTIEPDIRIVSKGLTNGLFPFSATLVSKNIMNHIQSCNLEFDYGLTMSGHPIGCALMIKSIELYQSSLLLRTQLEKDIKGHLEGCKVRAHGLLFGIDVPDGNRAVSDLKKLGYIIHNHNNILIFAPMFISQLTNYQTFFNYIHELY